MKNVAATREFNLGIARGPQSIFMQAAIADLHRIKNKIVRVHDSGDFFSQAYMNSWFEIAKNFPEKKFYAYTKSLHLNRSQQPTNFQIVQSVGGLMDDAIDESQPHSRIFATHADRKKAGYLDGNKNDLPAIQGKQRIGLCYHGNKNLTEKQTIWLKAV